MPYVSRWAFPPEPGSIRSARRFVGDALVGRADPAEVEALVLVTSELATNAVVHARSSFEVTVEADGVIRLELTDESPAPPVARSPGADEEGGRGLRIIESVCDRWGYSVERGLKRVWCELDRDPRG